jgi:general secretion pathway protein K
LSSAKAASSGGFALVVVLWVLVLIGFLVAHVTAAGNAELKIARNLYANAAAEAAAEGAISEAIFQLSDPDPARAWLLDGSRHELAIGRSRIMVRVDNEAWRINPNFASPALLEGLLRATGSDAATAQQVAVAIAEWVGMPVAGRSPAAAAADYRAAGLDYAPPRQPMESLDELGRVRGMTPVILAALRPHVTLYASALDPQTADPAVAAAAASASGQYGGPAGPGAPTLVSVSGPPARAAARPGAGNAPPGGKFITARITATARGPDNAEVTFVEVVRLDPAMPRGFVILAQGPSLE